MAEERWLPCPGYDGYEVSDLGRVRSWRSRNGRGRAKTPRLLDHGTIHDYPVVCLQRTGRQQTRFVHALVLEAFVGPCPEGMECRHFPDRTRSNATLTNLQWGTAAENAADREVHGKTLRGENHPWRRKPEVVPRGESHWMRKNPERIVRLGDRHWTRLHPERLKRGDEHHFRRNPECVPRGEKHSAALRGILAGEKNPRACITEKLALTIIAELRNGASTAALARKYAAQGATESRVHDIKRGKAWTHLPR